MSNRSKLVVVIAFVAGVAVGFWLHGWLQIDRCLDAGGRWSEGRGICEGPIEVLHEEPQSVGPPTVAVLPR